MYKTLQMYSVIAITGFKRSGKDLVAEYISHKYGYTHVKVASKLKSIIKLAFDLNDEDLHLGWLFLGGIPDEPRRERRRTAPEDFMNIIG